VDGRSVGSIAVSQSTMNSASVCLVGSMQFRWHRGGNFAERSLCFPFGAVSAVPLLAALCW
jgi:hypothetical protein